MVQNFLMKVSSANSSGEFGHAGEQAWDAVETYFQCITTCSIDDGECITKCAEELRESDD